MRNQALKEAGITTISTENTVDRKCNRLLKKVKRERKRGVNVKEKGREKIDQGKCYEKRKNKRAIRTQGSYFNTRR
jgi:hypothetical protein